SWRCTRCPSASDNHHRTEWGSPGAALEPCNGARATADFQSFTARVFLHVAVVYRCALGTPCIRGYLLGNQTTCTIRHQSARAANVRSPRASEPRRLLLPPYDSLSRSP